MLTMLLRAGAGFLTAAVLMAAPAAQAARSEGWGVDVPGGKDHPLVKRFTGSWLIGYKHVDWDQTRLPTGATANTSDWTNAVTVEGAITNLIYLSPPGKSRLEVFRNYEQALTAAGLKKKFACEKACVADLVLGMSEANHFSRDMKWAEGNIAEQNGTATYNISDPMGIDDGRVLYGTLQRDNREVHVLLMTTAASTESTGMAATLLQIVEPKPMPTGQVTVDAKALQTELQREGKVALYGLYFDTGKADVKPESKPQLTEMAKALKAQPAAKVLIVGHTDNQGGYTANVALSQKRAEAIVAALARDHGIAAARLQAVGVASAAPVASNAQEDGRARNRRVEMVLQ